MTAHGDFRAENLVRSPTDGRLRAAGLEQCGAGFAWEEVRSVLASSASAASAASSASSSSSGGGGGLIPVHLEVEFLKAYLHASGFPCGDEDVAALRATPLTV